MLITPLTSNQFPYLELKTLRSNSTLVSTNSSFSFHEVIHPPPLLLIVGAGHIAIPLALIAAQIGFRVIVQDDRPKFANHNRFPEATVLAAPIEMALDMLPHQLYVALVTRGYQYDLEAMQLLLQSSRSYQYLGLIGSKKRVDMVRRALIDVPSEKLQCIYAPIGLDIGALTPEEIAISICAELIKVRRGGTGLSLSERLKKANPKSQAAESIHLDLSYAAE